MVLTDEFIRTKFLTNYLTYEWKEESEGYYETTFGSHILVDNIRRHSGSWGFSGFDSNALVLRIKGTILTAEFYTFTETKPEVLSIDLYDEVYYNNVKEIAQRIWLQKEQKQKELETKIEKMNQVTVSKYMEQTRKELETKVEKMNQDTVSRYMDVNCKQESVFKSLQTKLLIGSVIIVAALVHFILCIGGK